MKCLTSQAPTASNSCLTRINSKKQFNYAKVLSVNIMGRQVPIVCNVRLSSQGGKRGPVFYGGTPAHKCFLYEDVQHSVCCRKVIKFNIDHYIKCYLPGRLGTNDAITTPYTFNHCRKCDVSVEDKCGKTLGFSNTRYWRNGILIYKACKTVQMCADCGLNKYSSSSCEDKSTGVTESTKVYNNNQTPSTEAVTILSNGGAIKSSSCGCGK